MLVVLFGHRLLSKRVRSDLLVCELLRYHCRPLNAPLNLISVFWGMVLHWHERIVVVTLGIRKPLRSGDNRYGRSIVKLPEMISSSPCPRHGAEWRVANGCHRHNRRSVLSIDIVTLDGHELNYP
eukprot:503838-Amphidinium_carterae.1